ncbi:hypothetical protein [Vitiosangium sp. GDMCC 1.1324]|uniref:hypothetical protein n=1 Tax=Vitiosangium sp. (strain GDMCC 1.1324) TaxID=2138576 RepID=UPI000D363B32|nr:hypothetical protein [Vitiosangium sp. GDMCC 1.1324]PTL83866.1 hypothetical protein DAT35_10415 [Vitiosangium sp. GDMCC 1.1324]
MALVTRGSLAATLLRGLAGVLAGGVLACGDSLVDESYLGTPRFTVDGSVNGTSASVDATNPDVSVAVFWMPRGTQLGGEDVLVEQQGTAIRAEYYRRFQVKLFDEPEAGSLVTLSSGARYGIAKLGAYRDANGNRRRDEEEPLLGLSDGRVLMRVPEALSARDSPTGRPLVAGWHILTIPFDCPPPEGTPPGSGSSGGPGPVPDGECAVPLGAGCKNDAECGVGGVCIHEYRWPWPGGACAIPEPPRDVCRQRGSVFVGIPEAPGTGYWLKGCQVSADCGRVAPYQCDQQNRACMPTAEIPVELQDSMSPQSLCRAPDSSQPLQAVPVP